MRSSFNPLKLPEIFCNAHVSFRKRPWDFPEVFHKLPKISSSASDMPWEPEVPLYNLWKYPATDLNLPETHIKPSESVHRNSHKLPETNTNPPWNPPETHLKLLWYTLKAPLKRPGTSMNYLWTLQLCIWNLSNSPLSRSEILLKTPETCRSSPKSSSKPPETSEIPFRTPETLLMQDIFKPPSQPPETHWKPCVTFLLNFPL